MSDIGLAGLVWGLVALGTTGVAGLGLALQPIVVLVVRRGRGASRRHVLAAFLGPLLATVVGALALLMGRSADPTAAATLDQIALAVPILALALWVGVSFALLRAR